MQAHESALLRYASGLVRNRHAAQDVVQNVFIKFFQHGAARFLPPDRLRHWLYRVAHNEAVDHIRRESRLRRLHESQAPDPEATPAPVPPAGDEEKIEQVLACIRRLDPPEQQVLLLRLQEGLSYHEISRVTGRSEGNVGCLLHHAVRKLARLVKRPTADAPGSAP